MAWISLRQNFRDHPKILRLAKELNLSEDENISLCIAKGAIASLWLWALEYARDGYVTKWDDYEITKAMGLPITKHIGMIDRLVKVELLDRSEDGTLYLHDWQENAIKFLKGNAERQSKARYMEKFKSIPVPENLNSPAFLQVWYEFADGRYKSKKPFTERAAERMLKKLARYPVDIAIKAVVDSDDNGWTGVFPEKYATNKRTTTGSRYQFDPTKYQD